MDVISIQFVILVIASAIIYHILSHKYRAVFLTIVSFGFIATYSYIMVAYVLVYSLINYYIGLKMPDSKNKIVLYRLGIIINLTQLILLKYASFSIDPLLHLLNSSLVVSKLSEIIIPIGISYFTLQGIGYLINIKMGWEKPETRLFDFILYISFFPKFLSGPIERSNHFLPQLKEKQTFDSNNVTEGMRIALFGLFKKVAIANQLAPYVMDTFANLGSLDGFSVLIMFLLLPIYLYFDFSGYTDIVIGLSRLFGINILPNFNSPFFAENVTTFWKRFHISLASWFNDYIFRQTVFRRRKWGKYASMYGVFLTFILFGIWHGAGWTFMILGLLQALALNYEFLTRKWRIRMFSKLPSFFRIWFGRIVTYLFYCVSLVFFFAPDLDSTFVYFSKLLHVSGPFVIEDISMKPFALIIYVPIFLIIELFQNDFQKTYSKLLAFWTGDSQKSRMIRWTVYSIIITIVFVVGLKAEQFVYVNF